MGESAGERKRVRWLAAGRVEFERAERASGRTHAVISPSHSEHENRRMSMLTSSGAPPKTILPR